MKLFRTDEAQAVKPFDESDLIAFHLNELPAGRMRRLRRALAGSATLAAELAAVGKALDAFKDVPLRVDDGMLDRSWAALRPLMVTHSAAAGKAAPVASRRSPLRVRGLLAGGLVAGTAAVTVFVLLHHGVPADRFRTDPLGRLSVTPKNAATEPAPHAALSTRPAAQGDGYYHLPSEPSAKARLSGGVFRPDPQQPGSPIHLLAPARVAGITSAETPLPLSSQPQMASGPLTLQPAGPAAARAGLASLEGPPASGPTELPPSAVLETRPAGRARRRHVTDVMLAIGGDFILPHHSLTAGTEPQSRSESPAISALAAFHQQFRPALGYRITAAYSRPDFKYTYSSSNSGGGFYVAGQIDSKIFELGGTYVIEGPHHRRLTTSADLGGALLAYVPATTNGSVRHGFTGAAVLGVSVDYALTKHLGARASYRAEILRTPGFGYSGGSIPVTLGTTLSSQPAVGITYRFGGQ